MIKKKQFIIPENTSKEVHYAYKRRLRLKLKIRK
jgi:hypothetical protein